MEYSARGVQFTIHQQMEPRLRKSAAVNSNPPERTQPLPLHRRQYLVLVLDVSHFRVLITDNQIKRALKAVYLHVELLDLWTGPWPGI